MLKSTLAKSLAAMALCSALVAPVFAADDVAPQAPQAGLDGKMPPPPQDGKGGPRGEHGGPFKDLDLTADQKAKIEEIHKAHRQTERQEIDAILTPEQLAKLKQHMADHPHHRGGEQGEAQGQGGQPPASPAEPY